VTQNTDREPAIFICSLVAGPSSTKMDEKGENPCLNILPKAV
jgi:hypothetical protein